MEIRPRIGPRLNRRSAGGAAVSREAKRAGEGLANPVLERGLAGGAKMMQELIRSLGLVPLPHEGGFYAEVYRSGERIAEAGLPARFSGDRALCTDIYYMLPGDGGACCTGSRVRRYGTSSWAIRSRSSRYGRMVR